MNTQLLNLHWFKLYFLFVRRRRAGLLCPVGGILQIHRQGGGRWGHWGADTRQGGPAPASRLSGRTVCRPARLPRTSWILSNSAGTRSCSWIPVNSSDPDPIIGLCSKLSSKTKRTRKCLETQIEYLNKKYIMLSVFYGYFKVFVRQQYFITFWV